MTEYREIKAKVDRPGYVFAEGPGGRQWMTRRAFDLMQGEALPGGPHSLVAPAAANSSTKAARFTQADVDKAVKAAVANERRRVANVFASPASHGRERGCAVLLASPKGWSSAAINRELPTLPTDRESAAKRSTTSSDAVWSKAYGVTEAAEARAKADQILAAQAKGGVNAPQVRKESSDPWARAYATIGRGR